MTRVNRSEQEWRKLLGDEAYHICREKGTERAFTGKYWDHKETGIYRCAGCQEPLFTSSTKYDSGCGWPSFFAPAGSELIEEHADNSHGMRRIEVTWKSCGSHLGHEFIDGPPKETGLRYCINSASLTFEKS